MTWQLSDQADLDALLVGVGLYGTGGGGDPKGWGRSIFDADRAAGRAYELVAPEEVPDDAFVLSGGYLGSVAEDVALNRLVENWESNFELERAIRVLEAEHGRKADYLIPFELGGGNTPVVLSCSVRLGIPMIDGDGVGRAAPETHMCSFMGHGISLTPMPLVGADGTEVVVRSGDIFLADAVGRCVASRHGGLLANAHYGMSGADLKRSVVGGSIRRALELGRFVLECDATGEAGLDAVSEFIGGFPVIRGRVVHLSPRASAGFYVVDVTLEGLGRDAGRTVELVVMNEAMCAKENGKPLSIFPDLLILLDPASLEGVMTPELQPGTEILLAAAPCHSAVRRGLESANGKAAFSSSRYGESFEYVPVEQLLGA
jgi:DUF917 family protein